MNKDQFLAGERQAYEDLFVATLRFIMYVNDADAAFKARKQFMDEQRYSSGRSFDAQASSNSDKFRT